MGGETSRALAALQRRVDEWRREQGGRGYRGAPIPEEIWQEAVEVARVEGVGATARALRFNAARLRQRMRRTEPAGAGGRAFVELGAMLGERGAMVVELVGADGARMRLELEMVGLLREVQLGDEEIDGLCVVRATDVDAMRRVWTEEARTRFKAMRNHARSVLSDGEKVWIEVVEESADVPLLVSMVELVAEIARAA